MVAFTDFPQMENPFYLGTVESDSFTHPLGKAKSKSFPPSSVLEDDNNRLRATQNKDLSAKLTVDVSDTSRSVPMQAKLDGTTSATVTHITHRESESFPFLSLPAELRVLVYQELLLSDDRLSIYGRGPCYWLPQKRIDPSILRVCRAIHEEGTVVLYGENVFNFGHIMQRAPWSGPRFRKTIGPKNAGLIRIVVAEYSVFTENFESGNQVLLDSGHISWLLDKYGVALKDLHMLAVSVSRGSDVDEIDSSWAEDANMPMNDRWLEMRNLEVEAAIDKLLEQEKFFKKVESHEVGKGICLDKGTSGTAKHWLVHQKPKTSGT